MSTKNNNLIETAYKRPLTFDENAQLVASQWKGTAQEFSDRLKRAYALAKQYDRFGGGKPYQNMMYLFTKLGSSDFGTLYAAKRVLEGETTQTKERAPKLPKCDHCGDTYDDSPICSSCGKPSWEKWD